MKLVIGGAYQGKLEYARKAYEIEDGWADGAVCSCADLEKCRGIDRFHELVKRMLFKEMCPGEKGDSKADEVCFTETADRDVSERDNQITPNDWPVFSMSDLSQLEQQAEAFADALYQKNPDIVVVSNELGYGVVPMEKADRMWREAVGRICTVIAARSDEVVRVVCGIGMKLK